MQRNLDGAVANVIGDGQCDGIKVAQGCTAITLLWLCALTKERDTIVGKREMVYESFSINMQSCFAQWNVFYPCRYDRNDPGNLNTSIITWQSEYDVRVNQSILNKTMSSISVCYFGKHSCQHTKRNAKTCVWMEPYLIILQEHEARMLFRYHAYLKRKI